MKRLWQMMLMFVLAIAGSIIALPLRAQIAVVRPDVAAPGMSVVLEVLAKSSMPEYFGSDGFDPKNVSCFTRDPADSERVKFGPLCLSWNGRLLQIPVFVDSSQQVAVAVPIVIRGQNFFDTIDFRIVLPQQLSILSGKVVLDSGANGVMSPHNTLVVDHLIANNATITISHYSSLEPITILSAGPIVLTNSTISVRASGVDGGPGGGGGGAGYQGEGGAGFTGGGNSGVRPPSGNIGSDVNDTPTVLNGGPSLTGVIGGGSDPDKDQGGGGGTGCPFGSSGAAGLENANSPAGGYGGGSGGGEANQINLAYGGGGGGFGTDGQSGGGGITANNGHLNGGRFLIPLQGGSGGGAGNSEGLGTGAGNGGGGGGAIALVAFDSVSLRNSTIIAEGDSGTSGAKNTAGGGGGSGGAVLVGTNARLSATNFGIQIDGGAGGQGGANGLSGGNEFAGGGGGFGRLRIDGGNPTVNIPLTSIASSVISVQKPATVLQGNWMKLSGFATDNANESDSIRIYYRTNRTAWTRVDTVRNHATGTWSKWIPRTFDSLLLVETCIKIINPSNTTANLEPDWAMSHAGLMIYSEPATPHLASIDTVSFGSERLGQCKTLKFLVKNDGSAALRIDSIKIGGKQYTVAPSSGFTLTPYSSDTLSVTFCPDSAKLIVGSLQLYSNDQISNPKYIVLDGTGTLKNDSLAILPSSVRFDRVVVGHCDSIRVTLRSAGKDTVYLLGSSWNKSPFSVTLSPSDSSLAPGDSISAIVHFCPVDTSDFSASFTLDEHGSAIDATGHAVIRRLQSVADTTIAVFCFGHDAVFDVPIRNVGNDTVSLESATTSGSLLIIQTALPILLAERATKFVSVLLKSSGEGSFVDTISFRSADSTLTSIIRYKVIAPSIAIDSLLDFKTLCAGLSDTLYLRMHTQANESLLYRFDTTGIGTAFTVIGDSGNIPPPPVSLLKTIIFHPGASGVFSKQIKVRVTDSFCDSLYTVQLLGTGSTGALAATDLTFDTTLVGECLDDSMLVQNPCGPAQTLSAISVKSPFQFLDGGLQPITILPGGSVMLHFRFCPDSSGVRSQVLTLGTIQTTIKGFGKDTSRPWAAFKILSPQNPIKAGETGQTTVVYDSSSLKGVHSMRVNVLFDPTVAWPESATPARAVQTSEGVYSFDTTIDLSKTEQSLDVITWRGLIGPKQSTVVTTSVTPDTLFDLRVRSGMITVTDCYNLSGSITVSGPYILHAVRPSIVSNDATVTLEFGNAGRAIGEVLDMTGRHISTIFDRDFERGVYDIPLNLNGVSSGRYMFVVRSLDWQGMTPFIVDR